MIWYILGIRSFYFWMESFYANEASLGIITQYDFVFYKTSKTAVTHWCFQRHHNPWILPKFSLALSPSVVARKDKTYCAVYFWHVCLISILCLIMLVCSNKSCCSYQYICVLYVASGLLWCYISICSNTNHISTYTHICNQSDIILFVWNRCRSLLRPSLGRPSPWRWRA
jgi:hypothetical protein